MRLEMQDVNVDAFIGSRLPIGCSLDHCWPRHRHAPADGTQAATSQPAAAVVASDPPRQAADSASGESSQSEPAGKFRKRPTRYQQEQRFCCSCGARSIPRAQESATVCTWPRPFQSWWGTAVMISSGVFVQGVVDRVVRAGRMTGKCLSLTCTLLPSSFPNGSKSLRFPA